MKPTPLLTGWTCRHLGDTAPGKTGDPAHNAMLAEPRTALSAGGTNTGSYEGYDYEYRRTLTVPENELADTHILSLRASTIMPRSGSTVKRQRSALTATPTFMLIVHRICTQARTGCVSLPATPTSPTAGGIPARASTARCSLDGKGRAYRAERR